MPMAFLLCSQVISFRLLHTFIYRRLYMSMAFAPFHAATHSKMLYLYVYMYTKGIFPLDKITRMTLFNPQKTLFRYFRQLYYTTCWVLFIYQNVTHIIQTRITHIEVSFRILSINFIHKRVCDERIVGIRIAWQFSIKKGYKAVNLRFCYVQVYCAFSICICIYVKM